MNLDIEISFSITISARAITFLTWNNHEKFCSSNFHDYHSLKISFITKILCKEKMYCVNLSCQSWKILLLNRCVLSNSRLCLSSCHFMSVAGKIDLHLFIHLSSFHLTTISLTFHRVYSWVHSVHYRLHIRIGYIVL